MYAPSYPEVSSMPPPPTSRYSEKPFPEFKGPLAVNEELKKAQKLFENEVVGPEAFAMDTKGQQIFEVCGEVLPETSYTAPH